MSEDKECREAFELWFKSGHEDFNFHGTSAPTGWYYFDDDVDGAWSPWQAAWSRAAKPAVPEGLVDLLRDIRPNYGDVGSRDVDVAEKQRKIDAAIALLSAAPPLPVAQGVPDIGAIWEKAICEVETGIKLAELRPNQIPGLFQILRRNVEAKLAAAPKEPTT